MAVLELELQLALVFIVEEKKACLAGKETKQTPVFLKPSYPFFSSDDDFPAEIDIFGGFTYILIANLGGGVLIKLEAKWVHPQRKAMVCTYLGDCQGCRRHIFVNERKGNPTNQSSLMHAQWNY